MKALAAGLNPVFGDLAPPERQAMLEKLAVTLERNARWAAQEGDDALGTAMLSVGAAILSVAGDLATTDAVLAEDVATRALGLITTFHCRHPQYPLGPMLH